MPREFTSATVGLGRPSCGGRRTSRCLQRDCVLPSARAVRPAAAREPSVPLGRSASNPCVPTNARSSQVGRVRFPLKPMTVERIIICITGSSRGINATVVQPCSLVGPAEYRSAWAAGAARRQLSLGPRGVVLYWLPEKCRPPPQCGLTLPSRGRPQASFACLRPPLMSNVRRLILRVLSTTKGKLKWHDHASSSALWQRSYLGYQ